MSIEYQLYSMSLTNQIIIPIVESRQSLQDQNIFMATPLILTPRKDDQNEFHITWKKSNSAFKRFKSKKYRKNKKGAIENQKYEEAQRDGQVERVKLIRLNLTQVEIKKKMECYEKVHINYGYFDPNKAPLFDQRSFETNCDYQQPNQSLEKIQKRDEEQNSQKVFQENVQKPLENISSSPQQDDTFIIIKSKGSKRNHLKNSKSEVRKVKTKIIKKDKNDKIKETTDLQIEQAPIISNSSYNSQKDQNSFLCRSDLKEEIMDEDSMEIQMDEILQIEVS